MSIDKSPTSCPKCNAERRGSLFNDEGPPVGIRYECYTSCTYEGAVTQSPRCKITELTAKLAAAEQQLAAAREEIVKVSNGGRE